jgi:hypothetical protein
MKLVITLILIIVCNFTIASNKINIVIIIGDLKMTTSDVKKMADVIYLNEDYKVDNFSIFHFSNNVNNSENWSKKKKNISYKSNVISCDFDLCSDLKGIINVTRTNDSKLYFGEENTIDCNFPNNYITKSILLDNQYTTISEEIKKELKNSKEEKTLFFYVHGKKLKKQEVLFEKDTIEVTSNEDYKITPIIKSNFKSYKWFPSSNLSCSDCKNPVFNGENSSSFQLICVDSNGCEVVSHKIYLKIKKNCDLGNQPTKLLLKEYPPKYVFVNNKGKNEKDWNIASNSSGGLTFDLLASNNCYEKYKVILMDLVGKEIWEQEYYKAATDKRALTNLHELFPDKNVFHLDLDEFEERINDKVNPFIVKLKIITYDNNNNIVGETISGRLQFNHCNE